MAKPHYCVLLAFALAILLNSCAFRRISRSKNITYQAANTTARLPAQELSIFAPRRHKSSSTKDVLVYIHGGNWSSGDKKLYNWFGSRLARKGIVAVVIDYPLSPAADYSQMAQASARSVKWVQEHIAEYGGDPARIFVSGHSAGGHLAALIAMDDSYFKEIGLDNPVKGIILIDAAGLDMYGYLQEGGLSEEPSYARIFGSSPEAWKKATPLYHLRRGIPPMLIFRGGRTYPSILRSNEKFVVAQQELGLGARYIIIPKRKHIPMITQFFNTRNRYYTEMIRFMKERR